MMHMRGIIFDMDGVLVDSYTPHLESWRRLGAELGFAITDGQFAATFGRTSREIIAMLFGGCRDDTDIRRLDEHKESIYRDLVRGRVPAMPGAVDLVRALHARGFRLAIGSSGPPANVRLVLDEMGITSFLSAVVTGADVTRGKPDPQVFQLAAERLQLPPAQCVVIEDAPVGIEAARRAGCKVIALASTHAADALRGADHVVGGLAEVKRLLA